MAIKYLWLKCPCSKTPRWLNKLFLVNTVQFSICTTSISQQTLTTFLFSGMSNCSFLCGGTHLQTVSSSCAPVRNMTPAMCTWQLDPPSKTYLRITTKRQSVRRLRRLWIFSTGLWIFSGRPASPQQCKKNHFWSFPKSTLAMCPGPAGWGPGWMGLRRPWLLPPVIPSHLFPPHFLRLQTSPLAFSYVKFLPPTLAPPLHLDISASSCM